MRWKALMYDTDTNDNTTIDNHYGFKTKKCPPQHKDLDKFEEELIEVMKKVPFHNVHNAFQEKLRNDIKLIREKFV